MLEQNTPRWHAQKRLVEERFGGFAGLRVVELGAGRGLNGLLYARRGAAVTLVDPSAVALEQARELWAMHDVSFEAVGADALELPTQLIGAFDVSMSYGLCEHFVQDRRRAIVAAHLEVLRPGGLAFLGVPNRYAPVYRLWMGVLKQRGTWPLGTEEPFSVSELRKLARAAGGQPLEPSFGSFAASVVNHGINQLRFKLGRRGLEIPQVRVPVLDRLAYELLLPVLRPEGEAD